jgi:hypothetical protein
MAGRRGLSLASAAVFADQQRGAWIFVISVEE